MHYFQSNDLQSIRHTWLHKKELQHTYGKEPQFLTNGRRPQFFLKIENNLNLLVKGRNLNV